MFFFFLFSSNGFRKAVSGSVKVHAYQYLKKELTKGATGLDALNVYVKIN